MKKEFIKEFVEECKKNREYLGYTSLDMSNCLVNVSENDYLNFENLNYEMSKDNLIRIAKVLCVNKPMLFDVSDYIDISNLDEEEIDDLTSVIKSIVGDNND